MKLVTDHIRKEKANTAPQVFTALLHLQSTANILHLIRSTAKQ